MDQRELQNKIRKLLKDRHAVLLVHYYQPGEIQDIADILGDSLALSLGAAKTDADVIVFAGVHFMAESASIICPDKTVLLPRLDVGCPLADMITVDQLVQARKSHPGVPIVTYINSSAEIKAHSDICCTSSNALNVVASLGDKTVIMAPDGNLARYISGFTDKHIIPWDGYCPVHHFLTVDDVRKAKRKYPRALFAAHPECSPDVLAMADFAGGTGGILRFAGESGVSAMIIGTEMGLLHQLKKQNPKMTFIPASEKLICRTMKLITLNDIFDALSEMKHIIRVPEEIRIPARKALDRMLAIP
ncbi:MAG: quinolinate synthase NadA [Deltaproteobacteria bacterium]